jgi:hypothetical protein
LVDSRLDPICSIGSISKGHRCTHAHRRRWLADGSPATAAHGGKLADAGLVQAGVLDLARGFHWINERDTRNLTRARTRSYR